MTKIARKHQKTFATSVPVTNTIAQFGSLKAADPNYSDDPDVIQALDAFDEGWASAVINNKAPALQDMNALFYLLTRQIAYLMQAGVAEYNAAATYYIGSLATDSTEGKTLYVSVADDNIGSALTDATKWMPLASRKVRAVIADHVCTNADWLVVFTDLVESGEKVTLPAPAAANVGREIIVKLTGSSFTSQLKIETADASTLDGAAAIYLSQYGIKRFVSDGTNWHVT